MSDLYLKSPARAARYGLVLLLVCLLSVFALAAEGMLAYATLTWSILPVMLVGLWPELREDPAPVSAFCLVVACFAFNGVAYLRPLVPSELLQQAVVWRVHHIPALTTRAERQLVADSDALDALFSSVHRENASFAKNEAVMNLERWLVASEVRKREHAQVTTLQILDPGMAKANFVGGSAVVRFGFQQPMSCPTGKDHECEQHFLDNPTGFKVLSYESHRG